MNAVVADKSALMKVGNVVRRRLAADPAVHKIPVDTAEIFAVGDFLNPDECAHLMGLVDKSAQPSTTYGIDAPGNFRTSYSGNMDPYDSFVRMVERRICDLMGINETWGETFQGQRYAPGQEFKPHYDWFDTGAPYWSNEKKRGGQRSWTAMAYLNDVEEGGDTVFKHLGLAIAPQRGALLLWNNASPDGKPNPWVLHAGTPVIRGTKYIITKWFRTRRWT